MSNELKRRKNNQTDSLKIGGDQLIINELHFSYGLNMPVYKGIDMTVHVGEFIAIVGPSGCEKTTLLNLLSGFSKPDKGKILLGSREIKAEDPNLAYFFNHPFCFPG